MCVCVRGWEGEKEKVVRERNSMRVCVCVLYLRGRRIAQNASQCNAINAT